MVKRVAAAAIVLALGACNILVGIGEHHLRDDAADASMDASADVAPIDAADASTADGPAPIVIASHQQNPSWIMNDATSVYWVNEANGASPGAIMRVDKAGGPPMVVAPARARPMQIRFDSNVPFLYFTDDFVPPGGGTFGLFKVPRGGGAVTTIDVDGTGYGYGALANVGALCSAAVGPNGQGARVRCSSKAGPPQTPCYPYATAAIGATLPAMDGDLQYIFTVDTAANAIIRAEVGDCTGANAVVFATSQQPIRHVVSNGAMVHWTTTTEVWRLDRNTPGGTPFLLASGFKSLRGLGGTLGGAAIAVVDEGAGAVFRVRYPSVTTIAVNQGGPRHVISDGTDVLYWTNRATGEVMRSP